MRTEVRTREPQGRGANPVREPAASKGSRCRRPHTLRARKNLKGRGSAASWPTCALSLCVWVRVRSGSVVSMPAPLAIIPTNIA